MKVQFFKNNLPYRTIELGKQYAKDGYWQLYVSRINDGRREGIILIDAVEFLELQ